MIQSYILIFSIGPVQSFIAQARKTQDLFGGSRLLSYLCSEAIEYSKSCDIEIVFPIVRKQKSIPNRFVGIINKDSNTLRDIGRKIEHRVKETFLDIAKEKRKEYGVENVINFEEQVRQHLDINWIFYPIENNYETDYSEAERWFGAVKSIRQFNQLVEKGRKCSLDGERNVKVYKLSSAERNRKIGLPNKLFQEQREVHIVDENETIPLRQLAEGEGLSAVSFIKRAFETQDFPSTARVALMDTLNKIWSQSNEAVELLISYKNDFKDVNFDEQLFFEENLNKDYFRSNGYTSLIKSLPEIKDKYENLVKYLKSEGLSLQKYYALIVFDGDKMGEVIAGTGLKPGSKYKLKDFQKRTSELLAEYAEWAFTYLDNPKGQTVYAGGDDFMGFVNLSYLYEVMQELYDKFDTKVNQVLNNEFTDDLSEFNFTFSAGVVITHYKTPLSIVLKKTRLMEHFAKEDGGRDAFAMSVVKHSGESHSTVVKWSYLNQMKNIVEQLLHNNYSTSFIKNIQIEMRNLGFFRNRAFADYGEGKKITESEIRRLIGRAYISGQQRGSMIEDVITIYKKSNSFRDFSEALNVIEFIKRQLI